MIEIIKNILNDIYGAERNQLITNKTIGPTIYVVQNKINGKCYIGQTWRGINERWRKHISRAFNRKWECRAISAAIRKYGVDSFKIFDFKLPINATQITMDLAEINIISKLNTLSPNGYNLETGGKNGKPSLESIEKRRSKLKGKKLSNEHKEKLSKAQTGRKRNSPAEILGYKKLVEMRKGKNRPQSVIDNMIIAQRKIKNRPRSKAQIDAAKRHSEFMKGRKFSEERKRKHSEILKAYHLTHVRSEETRAKMSAAQKGRIFSDETKEKMKIARRKYLDEQSKLINNNSCKK